MRSTLIAATLLLFSLLACNQSGDPELKAIAALESEVNEGASAEKLEELVGLYEKYVAGHPKETETNANLLHKAAFLQYNNHRYQSAIKLLKEALYNYYSSDKTPESALFLASIYQKHMDNPVAAHAGYFAFLQAFPGHPKAAFVRDSVLAQSPDLFSEIDSLRSRIFDENANRYNATVSNEFINTCEIYGLLLPKDPKTPDLLYDAARTAGYIRTYPKAVELYEWVYSGYPDYSKANQALFMLAFTYDDGLKDVENAKKRYQEFLEKYPSDDFADDALVLLQNLGKSEEEVMQTMERR